MFGRVYTVKRKIQLFCRQIRLKRCKKWCRIFRSNLRRLARETRVQNTDAQAQYVDSVMEKNKSPEHIIGTCAVFMQLKRKHLTVHQLIDWELHTYIYIIGHYNPSVRIIDLVSHTTCVVCVNSIHKWRDLQFKVDSERQLFEKLFRAILFYSQSFCQKSAERKSPKKYFSYFILMSGLGLEPWLFV